MWKLRLKSDKIVRIVIVSLKLRYNKKNSLSTYKCKCTK